MSRFKKHRQQAKQDAVSDILPELQNSRMMKLRIALNLTFYALAGLFLIYDLIFHVSDVSDLIYWSIFAAFLIILIVFEVTFLRKKHHGRKAPPQNLAEVRDHLHHKSWRWERSIFGILPVLIALPREKRWWNECLDFRDLRSFDWEVRHGNTVPIPALRSELGQQYLQWYIKFYREEHGIDLPSETWVCTCGRENSGYILTCVCGAEQKTVCPDPALQTWHCSCGRDNPHYTSTCVCGENKRVLKREDGA